MGYTGFTLVMPFLPLFIGQLGVTDVGEIAMWTGLSLGMTPGLTAVLAPAWGRLGDRFGRKIMVERSLVSFVVLFAAMAFVNSVWQVLALRAIQGLFAGYGSLSVAMAAESAPRDRMPSAIGAVQTAQRIGPGVGPVIGGLLAGAGRLAPGVPRDGAVLCRRPRDRARRCTTIAPLMRSRPPRPRPAASRSGTCWRSGTSS